MLIKHFFLFARRNEEKKEMSTIIAEVRLCFGWLLAEWLADGGGGGGGNNNNNNSRRRTYLS